MAGLGCDHWGQVGKPTQLDRVRSWQAEKLISPLSLALVGLGGHGRFLVREYPLGGNLWQYGLVAVNGEIKGGEEWLGTRGDNGRMGGNRPWIMPLSQSPGLIHVSLKTSHPCPSLNSIIHLRNRFSSWTAWKMGALDRGTEVEMDH